MKQIYTVLSFCALLIVGMQSHVACAQGRNGVWYFGNRAGISFGSNGPVALSDGMLNSYEACASIATPSGNLALYTDGEKVWDATHQLMPNGSGMGGHTSASQSALILPYPGNPTQYIVFIVDAIDNNLVGGLRYSLVDMSLRGGLGDVLATTKTVRLPTPTLTGKVTEKLTAALHANGRDYWVVVHGWENNDFYSFLVSPSGISTSPVASSVGPVHAGGGSFFGAANAVGYMRISPLGTHLALAKRDSDFELYNFDNSTGIVSNYTSLNGTNTHHYGVEFSPDNTRLYTSMYSDGGFDSQVYQFNLTAGSGAAIRNSRQTVASVTGLAVPLQLGPDGRIYVSAFNQPYLHAINQPNALGTACGFQQFAVLLGQKTGQNGLPNMPNAFARQVNSNASPELAKQVTLYPNPAHREVYLTLPSTLRSSPATLNFINSLGETVKTLVVETGSEKLELSLANLAGGVYTFRINSKAGVVTKKLVID